MFTRRGNTFCVNVTLGIGLVTFSTTLLRTVLTSPVQVRRTVRAPGPGPVVLGRLVSYPPTTLTLVRRVATTLRVSLCTVVLALHPSLTPVTLRVL